MAAPDREAIETFMSITGAPEHVAVQRLEENLCDLNGAVNAFFNERDRNIMNETSVAAQEDDYMDLDDPSLDELQRGPFLPLSSARNLNPFQLLDPNFTRGLLGPNSAFTGPAPFVSHPREVREIPIEVKDGGRPPSPSGLSPRIEDVTGTDDIHGPGIPGTVIIADDDSEDNLDAQTVGGRGLSEQRSGRFGDSSRGEDPRPSAPEFEDIPDYGNDIEEEMIKAAVEASKREAEGGSHNKIIGAYNGLSAGSSNQRQPPLEDADFAHAVSLSLKTAEQEKTLREQGVKIGISDCKGSQTAEVGLSKSVSNGRLETGSSSLQDEFEDVEEQPLVRHKSRNMSSSSTDSAKVGDATPVNISPPRSEQQNTGNESQENGDAFRSDAWGGISSEEHDEAVMLEAAMFGGIPEGSNYSYAPRPLIRPTLNSTVGPYAQQLRPPSPSLEAQRLIREQQDDEYLASLQADREKELKAKEEAEARHLMELAAKEAALEEERVKEEESRKKIAEEEEFERQLAAKEASLPREPASDNENAVTLLVRMPDGSRRGRRFLKSDKLQFLFDFIDVGRGVKPGTYRLVRPYPRRAFGDGEILSTLSELGLTSKQEALFMELI